MTHPSQTCANCRKQYQHHVDEKCPFEASNFAAVTGLTVERVNSALFQYYKPTKPEPYVSSLLTRILF